MIAEERESKKERFINGRIAEQFGEDAVKRVIERAEYDFDHACAVSPNGKKITIADYVAVVKEDGTFAMCEAGVFRERKIERPERMTRVKNDYHPSDFNRAVDMVARGKYDAVFAEQSRNTCNNWFVVSIKFVPRLRFFGYFGNLSSFADVLLEEGCK